MTRYPTSFHSSPVKTNWLFFFEWLLSKEENGIGKWLLQSHRDQSANSTSYKAFNNETRNSMDRHLDSLENRLNLLQTPRRFSHSKCRRNEPIYIGLTHHLNDSFGPLRLRCVASLFRWAWRKREIHTIRSTSSEMYNTKWFIHICRTPVHKRDDYMNRQQRAKFRIIYLPIPRPINP